MCDYCMPLEPYDASYHTEHNIKHLSYHSYLQKLTPKNSSSSFVPPLSPLSYKVNVPCPSGHPSWPAGICTACQPSAITLQPQPFRMLDHLEIASMDVINRFLQAWRMTGLQRFGWLIGRYEPYLEVPMGVKAVVEAIHEPPQQGELDGLSLGLPWEDEPRIRDLAQSSTTPLTIVGYIFTDLEPTVEDKTKTVYKRHPQSFYLSSLEAIFAATLQKTSTTPSKSSETGYFGSRLVTAVLTGTEDGQIDVAAYQVSEQAVAMVDADMIEASVEPGIVRVKEDDRSEDSARYVPDVFFRYKNEYGLEVKKTAKPSFPVEYLLVNVSDSFLFYSCRVINTFFFLSFTFQVSHGFPQNPSPIFRSTRFNIENRPGLEDQSIENVLKDLTRLSAPDISHKTIDYQKRLALAEWLSDWHLVSFLGTTQLMSPVERLLLVVFQVFRES
jgi:nuclear protein localization protein 4 homolog